MSHSQSLPLIVYAFHSICNMFAISLKPHHDTVFQLANYRSLRIQQNEKAFCYPKIIIVAWLKSAFVFNSLCLSHNLLSCALFIVTNWNLLFLISVIAIPIFHVQNTIILYSLQCLHIPTLSCLSKTVYKKMFEFLLSYLWFNNQWVWLLALCLLVIIFVIYCTIPDNSRDWGP